MHLASVDVLGLEGGHHIVVEAGAVTATGRGILYHLYRGIDLAHGHVRDVGRCGLATTSQAQHTHQSDSQDAKAEFQHAILVGLLSYGVEPDSRFWSRFRVAKSMIGFAAQYASSQPQQCGFQRAVWCRL